MRSDNKKKQKQEAMKRVRAVQAILRKWDPFAVRPGELAPADEYDSYAPHIVSMVTQGCSVDQLSRHLGEFAGADRKRDADIASEIIATVRSEAV